MFSRASAMGVVRVDMDLMCSSVLDRPPSAKIVRLAFAYDTDSAGRTSRSTSARRTPPGYGRSWRGTWCTVPGSRRSEPRRPRRVVKPVMSGRDQVQAVRYCARQNGYGVSARGRIPKVSRTPSPRVETIATTLSRNVPSTG